MINERLLKLYVNLNQPLSVDSCIGTGDKQSRMLDDLSNGFLDTGHHTLFKQESTMVAFGVLYECVEYICIPTEKSVIYILCRILTIEDFHKFFLYALKCQTCLVMVFLNMAMYGYINKK